MVTTNSTYVTTALAVNQDQREAPMAKFSTPDQRSIVLVALFYKPCCDIDFPKPL